MYAVGLLVISTLSTFVTGTDYLISVHTASYVDVSSDNDEGGSVRVAYPNHDIHQGYGFVSGRSFRLDKTFSTMLGYDNNTILISSSHSAIKVQVYSRAVMDKYNLFFSLPLTALGTRYVVSSCIQNFEYSILVITAYKRNADVAIRFDTDVEFSHDGQNYGKGDIFRISLKAFQTFTFRVKYDLSGTRINSTDTIAVFSGTADITTVYTYTQLLPVEQFSDEYVVTVDDSLPSFQLQIVGEDNGFEITFSNGTLASTNNGILNRLLKTNETFHFESSKPVMATLCRSVGDQKGFALIPPVSSYPDHKEVSLTGTTLIVTLNTTTIRVNGANEEWKHISNSKFKVGTYSLKSYRGLTSTQTFRGISFFFIPNSFVINRVSMVKDEPQITDLKDSFIFVAPSVGYANERMAVIGENEDFYQVRCPGRDLIKSRYTYPYVEDYMEIPAGTLCIVNTDEEKLHLFLQEDLAHILLSAPILPITSLGKKYVIPSYDVNIVSQAQITIATGNWTASVDVTNELGSVTRYELAEYKTRTINSEAAGMVLSASQEIAVFNEHRYADYEAYKEMFTQLIPSEDFGKEYVLAVGSLRITDFFKGNILTESYYINITCLDNNTSIVFNDGVSVTIGKSRFFRKDVMVNGSLQFTCSKPVMVYLCMKAEFHGNDGIVRENPCSILPPVEQYRESALISIPANAYLKILTNQENDDFHAFTVDNQYQNTQLAVDWKNIPNTHYKVGTATTKGVTLFMESTKMFSTIMYSFNCCLQALLVISTISRSVHQRTTSLSTTAGLTSELTSTSSPHDFTQTTDFSSELTSAITLEDHHETTDYLSEKTSISTLEDHHQKTYIPFPSSSKVTSEVSSFTTPNDYEYNGDGNTVMDEDKSIILLVVGCVCGIIILVLGFIIGSLVIRMRRNNKSNSIPDTQTSRTSHTLQETSLEGENTTPETREQRSHSNIEEEESHIYLDLIPEPQSVNEYESVDGIHANPDTPQQVKTYSDLIFEGQADNEYEKIDHKRQENNSDYANV